MQRRLFDLLSDGGDHTRTELHGCLVDELGAESNVRPHLTYLRGKIRPFGLDIISIRTGQASVWRMIRLVARSNS